ncbi:MAG: winged helix-turn-helix domain-containing protein [Candidatus Thorarchaeota archaeon]
MNSESENVLKALSSSTRRIIMRQISEKGTATYTEIMHVLNLDPSLMSGKFNYHLKELSEAGLIERTNGEYRITDLGKRALILVDQVAKETKIDRYGVLSAVMSMSPKKELDLFTSQMGFMIGFMLTILSTVGFILIYESASIWVSISGIVLLLFLTLTIVSTAKMINIIRKFRIGVSAIVFLSSNWFFIRSPNRNSFFAITFFAAGAVVAGILTFLLPISDAMQWYSVEWWGLLISAINTALLTIGLLIHARRKAYRLEEAENEQ